MTAKSQDIINAESILKRYGYEAKVHTDSNTLEPKFVIVMDPIFASGTGINAGKLVFMHDEPCIVRSYDAARKFINARS